MFKKIFSKLSTGKSWYTYFRYEENEEKRTGTRNVLLVVSTLIAAVTFQAGVNPPGGVWQDTEKKHIAGRAIYASQPQAYKVFLIANTVAFSSAILVIISLTHRFPFQLEVFVATISMMVTYASAIFAVTPRESVRFRYVILTVSGPFILRALIHLFSKFFGEQKGQSKLPEVTPGRVSQ
ncbi:hypothetical protein PTKIN_Ptkin15bG0012900 [Pterospermum kingtungense]